MYAVGKYERVNGKNHARGTVAKVIQSSNCIGEAIRGMVHTVSQISYLRISGFEGSPYKFPKYPTDKLVLLEVARQANATRRILKEKVIGVSFPMAIGDNNVYLKTPAHTKQSREELASYGLQITPFGRTFILQGWDERPTTSTTGVR